MDVKIDGRQRTVKSQPSRAMLTLEVETGRTSL